MSAPVSAHIAAVAMACNRRCGTVHGNALPFTPGNGRGPAAYAFRSRGAVGSATIADYLRGGLVADPEAHAMRLACKPSWEAATFRAAPFGKARLARRVSCPITVLYGTIASTCRDSEVDVFKRAGARTVKVDGASHFLPMEHPDLVREEIVAMAGLQQEDSPQRQ